jgi:DtxR family Mn-dependent transcriptional regulator
VTAVPALTRSRQDYLKALYALAPAGEAVATSHVARRLGLSAPSVTNMLARLARERLVSHTPRGGARLTVEGRRQAIGMVRRHRIIECFLVQVLGLDWSEVHDDAEVLEHHISDRVLEAMDRLVGHPHEDPHGHPIPDARGRVKRRRLVPLARIASGGNAVVREIHDSDARRVARWKELGIVPGARVRAREVRSLDDLYDLDVEGRRVVTGSGGLDGVRVELVVERARGWKGGGR